jgi:cytosine/adenosine deaminase-related metal-dependent hydrolase
MSFILADACVVTINSANDVYERGSVLVREDRIADIGSKNELTAKEPNAEVIDCSCNILMPGMVNTHTQPVLDSFKGPGRRHGAEGLVQLHDRASRCRVDGGQRLRGCDARVC